VIGRIEGSFEPLYQHRALEVPIDPLKETVGFVYRLAPFSVISACTHLDRSWWHSGPDHYRRNGGASRRERFASAATEPEASMRSSLQVAASHPVAIAQKLGCERTVSGT
jgi:hypothetical protein